MSINTVFFKESIKHIRSVGALAPSSRSLVFTMARQVLKKDISRDEKVVVELGGGTGVLSLALAKIFKNAKGSQVFIIEVNEAFASMLEAKLAPYENTHVLNIDAKELSSALRQRGIDHVDYAFSCLPFLSLPKKLRSAIYKELSSLMSDEGLFVLFQYTSRILDELKRHFSLSYKKRVWANLPPALVYVMTKHG